jgi:hypothetical protein
MDFEVVDEDMFWRVCRCNPTAYDLPYLDVFTAKNVYLLWTFGVSLLGFLSHTSMYPPRASCYKYTSIYILSSLLLSLSVSYPCHKG